MVKRRKENWSLVYRDFAVRAEDVNGETREIALSFSSDEPIERWGSFEILDHSPNAVRLERLNDGAPFLVNHSSRQHVGVIVAKSVKIAKGVGRAVVRLGRGQEAEEIFRDIQDGIRTKVSVGYRIHEVTEEITAGVVTTYRVTDWEPYEISSVSVPADNSVGVGRAAPGEFETIIQEIEIMTPEEKRAAEEAAAAEKATREAAEKAARDANPNPSPNPAPEKVPHVFTNEAREQAIKAERTRAASIAALGIVFEANGGNDLAKEYIDGGRSFGEFESAMLARMKLEKPPSAEIGMSRTDQERFSIVRVLHALANPQNAEARAAAAFEFECSAAACKAAHKDTRGAVIPVDVLNTPYLSRDFARIQAGQRDLQATVAVTGGNTVATDILGTSFIDLLRNRMVLARAGMTVLSGLVGNIAIPRQTLGATAFWNAENVAPGESTQNIDQVTMVPHTVGAYSDISVQLLKQSSIDVEGLVRDDLTRVLAIEADRTGLNGSGAGAEPAGLSVLVGIGSVTIADLTNKIPTHAELVELETLVATANADLGALRYLVNADGRGKLKTTLKAAGVSGYLWEPGNMVNGYDALASQQIAANNFWFGNWNDVVMGIWGGLELTVDPLTQALNRLVRVMVFQDMDYAFRHPQSFALGD